MYAIRFKGPLIVTVIFSILLLATTLSGCISDPGEAKIVNVKKDSPAEESGLKKEMIIQYISYGEGENYTTKQVEGYDQVGKIISKLMPGELISLGVQYDGKDMVFENIKLAENSDHKGYLGVVCGPSSGVILSINHVIVYFFVIITISILILVISSVEKWIDRRNNGPDL